MGRREELCGRRWRCRWFTAHEYEGCWQRCKHSGRAGRAGRRLRPLFNRTTAAQRPVVIPSWRATPVSLLWPRASCSPAVSLTFIFRLQTPSISRRHGRRDVISALPLLIQWLRRCNTGCCIQWTVKLARARPSASRDRPWLREFTNKCSRARSPCNQRPKDVNPLQFKPFKDSNSFTWHCASSPACIVCQCCVILFNSKLLIFKIVRYYENIKSVQCFPQLHKSS